MPSCYLAHLKGRYSSGTGFLVRPGLLVTNAHVIANETVDALEVYFPAAQPTKRGPLKAELLYEDAGRDIAFLRVNTQLPALKISKSSEFTKGEEIVVIGNPAVGTDVQLNNAVSLGVLSTQTRVDGHSFFQLGVSLNPGNSGGPVLNSESKVIGVATLSAKNGLAFCIPAVELNELIAKVEKLPSRQSSVVRVEKHREFAKSFSITDQQVNATGVKRSVLLAVMNTNTLPDKRFHHRFVFRKQKDGMFTYKDAHSPLYLLTDGPSNDLTYMALVVSFRDLIDEQPDGRISADGAAALGRCVQRLAAAVDPNWVTDLYDWMNENMAIALITKGGISIRRKGLRAKFSFDVITDDLVTVVFAIGVPNAFR